MPRSLPAHTYSRKRPFLLTALAVVAAALGHAPAAAITLQFNYDYDATGFFGTALAPTPARTALEFAGRAFESFSDHLPAIQPGGQNSWTAHFLSPGTGEPAKVANLAVSQNSLVVFAGARDLPLTTLGEGGFGGFALGGGVTPAFQDAVVNRGQGAALEDFAAWGGAIVFDTLQSTGQPRQWHFDAQTAPAPGSFDFYSVAVHELAHLMGFGLSSAFATHVTGDAIVGYRFAGPTASSVYVGTVPMSVPGHWAFSVTSPPFVYGAPKPSLGPSLAFGERKTLTPLDYAALADTGWNVPAQLFGLTGDTDGDDDVDGADFLAWQRNLGGLAGSPGNVNGDQQVDALDGWLIRRFLGGQGPSALIPPETAAVPEPAAWALAALLTLRRHSAWPGTRRKTA